MKMKFIGRNGSLGFVKGRIYDVSIMFMGKKVFNFGRAPIFRLTAFRNGKIRYCEYESDRVMMKNREVQP